MQNAPSESELLAALRTVIDPVQRKDVVTLRMVKDIAVAGGNISVSLPMPPSPMRDAIAKDIRSAVGKVSGVTNVEVRFEAPAPQGPPPQRPHAHGPQPGQAPVRATLPGVKNLIAVASGKGGVGKTTVAVNLAIALQKMGASVGLMDADVYGPNVPVMLGANEQPRMADQQTIVPVEAYGLKTISMGLLNPGDKPLVWRGPMLHSVMQQFLKNVRWGELDYLIVDLPPGTGDVQLSLIQSVALTGAVIVTTPSIVALADVRKAVEMFKQVNVEILGVVENMSYFSCPHCNGRIDVFGHGEGAHMAKAFGVPLLGEIEIDPQIRIGGDTGKPVASLGEDAPGGKSIFTVARNVAARAAELSGAGAGPVVEIL
ncbi:MAG TPA: Mrp/NBP35 family ATP-binding protein [Candidatus Acidoferrales bacterium]|nr:Mrp/NBP35 family ATP-binding protein [Candidatus Acidoferrales bacterium]